MTKVLCQILTDDTSIRVKDGSLGREKTSSDSRVSSLPKDATTAVVAQFDKLSPDMKSILRVAAIAGIS